MEHKTSILVGIDEAGYGPILGPLVVTASVFELPEGLLNGSMWDHLAISVTKKRTGSAGRILVNDSKKLHQGQGDYRDLQRGVLAFLRARHQPVNAPVTLGDLLRILEADFIKQVDQYPWYGSAALQHPLSYDPSDIAIAANALACDLARQDIRFHGLWSRALCAGHFNSLVEKVNNKATVLFAQVTDLIMKAVQTFPSYDLQIVVDKQGGREHYRENLQRLFPDLPLKILRENESLSSYHLQAAARSIKIHFIAKGDDRQLPVALASMASKYLRELCMELINAYFRRHVPTIAPTAGYYQDGQRFLGDLKTAGISEALAPEHLLVRSR